MSIYELAYRIEQELLLKELCVYTQSEQYVIILQYHTISRAQMIEKQIVAAWTVKSYGEWLHIREGVQTTQIIRDCLERYEHDRNMGCVEQCQAVLAARGVKRGML